MSVQLHHKITARHLARRAFVYVRQSTVRQVFENTESTKRQYALKQTAITLGWPAEQDLQAIRRGLMEQRHR